MAKSGTVRVRRSVALPRELVEEAVRLAPDEIRDNLNRLIVISLEEYVARRKAIVFEQAMARMANDPAIRRACAHIAAEFGPTALDGLRDD